MGSSAGLLLGFQQTLQSRLSWPSFYFIVEGTESHRGQGTCPKVIPHAKLSVQRSLVLGVQSTRPLQQATVLFKSDTPSVLWFEIRSSI